MDQLVSLLSKNNRQTSLSLGNGYPATQKRSRMKAPKSIFSFLPLLVLLLLSSVKADSLRSVLLRSLCNMVAGMCHFATSL